MARRRVSSWRGVLMSEYPETDEEGNPICGRPGPHLDGDEICDNPPGHRTDHEGEGACWVCGGNAGAPEGNINGMTHGEGVPPSKYFEHLEPPQQQFTVDIYKSYMHDAPFGYDKFAKSADVWLLAIDRHKRLRINGLLADDGLVLDEEMVGPDGEVTERQKEHPLMLAYHRLARDNLAGLEKFGILDKSPREKLEEGNLTVNLTIHSVAAEEADHDEDDVDESRSGETNKESASVGPPVKCRTE